MSEIVADMMGKAKRVIERIARKNVLRRFLCRMRKAYALIGQLIFGVPSTLISVAHSPHNRSMRNITSPPNCV